MADRNPRPPATPWTARSRAAAHGPPTRRRRSDATRHRLRSRRRRRLAVLPLTLVVLLLGTVVAWSTAGRMTITEMTVVDEAGNTYTLEGSADLVLVPTDEETSTSDPEPTATETTTSSPEPTTTNTSLDSGGGGSTGDVRQLSGDVKATDGLTVPAGETYRFDPDKSTTLTVSSNIVVEGRLEMKPSSPDVVHTIRFTGADASQFAGGHAHEPVESDVGLWVTGDGQLDVQGTERAGWNRTGDDPTWRSSDELIVAPNEAGDHQTFSSFTKGDTVPSVTAPDGSVHRTEVANLTRNVVIEAVDGRAHVQFLHCQKPQSIRYATLRNLGVEGTLGRYPLHFHMCGDGSRGSVVEGVVTEGSRNHAFVPHASHGITFRDTVAYDTVEEPYWWDPSDRGDEVNNSNDVTFDHAAAFLIEPQDRPYSLDGFTLGSGSGNAVFDSVVAGNAGYKANAGGFMWPSSANKTENVWEFSGNVAHNNRGAGIGVWQNDANDHVVTDFVGYHNGHGISHGAYGNAYTYRDVLLFGNGTDLVQHALGPITFERFDLGTITIARHNVEKSATVSYRNVRVRDGITVNEDVGNKASPGVIEFRSSSPATDIERSQFEIESILSEITVRNSDGTTYRVR